MKTSRKSFRVRIKKFLLNFAFFKRRKKRLHHVHYKPEVEYKNITKLVGKMVTIPPAEVIETIENPCPPLYPN